MQRPQLSEFIKRMRPDSVAIIASAHEATRSNDTHYRYRQDSDFYYLTSFDEPEAIAVQTELASDKILSRSRLRNGIAVGIGSDELACRH